MQQCACLCAAYREDGVGPCTALQQRAVSQQGDSAHYLRLLNRDGRDGGHISGSQHLPTQAATH